MDEKSEGHWLFAKILSVQPKREDTEKTKKDENGTN
jgi:hypothetical protein